MAFLSEEANEKLKYYIGNLKLKPLWQLSFVMSLILGVVVGLILGAFRVEINFFNVMMFIILVLVLAVIKQFYFKHIERKIYSQLGGENEDRIDEVEVSDM